MSKNRILGQIRVERRRQLQIAQDIGQPLWQRREVPDLLALPLHTGQCYLRPGQRLQQGDGGRLRRRLL